MTSNHGPIVWIVRRNPAAPDLAAASLPLVGAHPGKVLPRLPSCADERAAMPGRADASWRLGRVASHVLGAVEAEPELPVSTSGFLVSVLLEPPPPDAVPADGALTEMQLAEYVARGFINLPRELIGLPPDHHERVHANHRAGRVAAGTAGNPYASRECAGSATSFQPWADASEQGCLWFQTRTTTCSTT